MLNKLNSLRLWQKLLIQGIVTVVILVVFKAWLDSERIGFLSYLPPLGFAFFLAVMFFAQPLVVGAVNIALINTLHKTRGWQVDIWLNGILLVLAFSTLNLVLQDTFNWAFLPVIAVIDILLAFPFGCLGRFSNGGWNKPID